MNGQAESHSADEPAFGAFVAIDWADRKHVWSMQAAGSERRQHGEILHTPEAIEVWVGELSSRFPGQRIAVAVEQSRGALVFMLRASMSTCISTRFIHARQLSFAPLCIPREPKTTPSTRTCCWICWCIIVCTCAV